LEKHKFFVKIDQVMERKEKQSIDGFVPRGQLAGKPNKKVYGGAPVLASRQPVKKQVKSRTIEAETDAIALKKQLQDSLRDLDVNQGNDFTDLKRVSRTDRASSRAKKADKLQLKLDKKNKKRERRGRSRLTVKQFKVRRWVKRIFILILIAILGYSGYLAYSAIKATDSIFDGGIFGFLQEQELMRDSNGRTNILIFGTEPEDHDGSNLTDSIIVVSLNQDDSSVYMTSLPRDLYIRHVYSDGVTTTRGKINEVYYYGRLQNQKRNNFSRLDEEGDDKSGATELKRAATTVTGLDIQYYVHLSWDAVRQVTDALGGIDVKIESDDSRGLYDPATGIKYTQGEVAHLDGEKALALVRSRGAFGGYGFSSSNFARERNQQAILRGMQQKALESGQLSNPQTVVDLLNALGDTLITDFQTSEVRTLAKVAKNMNPDRIITIPLMDPENNISYVTTGMIDGISYVMATAGRDNFKDIHEYIHEMVFAEGWEKERAIIDVLNGSGVSGLAASKAQNVKGEGFRVGEIGTAPTSDYIGVTIYRVNNKPATAKQLAELYGVEIEDMATTGGVVPSADADFVIIFGR
jgi:LCP family protein required for cell wall assembly